MSDRTVNVAITALSLVAVLLIPSAVRAQSIATDMQALDAPVATASASAPSALDGPRLVRSGISLDRTASAPALAPMRAVGTQRDVAWMIVGGATLVVGSVIGGDGGMIMMVTGGVIGLVGLMRYLQ
jgi:hypothetical protein